MNKFIEALQNFLMPIATAMNKNRYIRAMRDGFVLSLPYTMVGSILTSLFSIPALSNLLGGNNAGNDPKLCCTDKHLVKFYYFCLCRYWYFIQPFQAL